MAIRKSDDIANEESSDFDTQKNAAKLSNITERFDDTTHNDNPYDDAIQYMKKKIDEVVDETNSQTVASGSYAGDIKILKTSSGSFSTRVTTNETASGSFSTRVTTNETTIASNAKAVKALGGGLTNNAGALVISTNDDGTLVFTVGKSSWIIRG